MQFVILRIKRLTLLEIKSYYNDTKYSSLNPEAQLEALPHVRGILVQPDLKLKSDFGM